MRKTSVIVETFQLSFLVLVCAFRLEISPFFWQDFPLHFPVFEFFYIEQVLLIERVCVRERERQRNNINLKVAEYIEIINKRIGS